MRFAMRALVFVALPAVAFSWLLQVRFTDPHLPPPLDYGFLVFEPRNYLLEAVTGALPYVAVLASLAAVVVLCGPRPGGAKR
jgi:hypothetical protein